MDKSGLFRETSVNINTLRLSLPVPPSVNAIYYNTRGGGRRLTKKAEFYVRDSRALMNVAVEESHWVIPEKYVWLYVDMVYYFPDRRIRDSHNCLKILLDAMQGIIFQNDYVVLPRIHAVEYDKSFPRVDIKVTRQTESERERGLLLTHL
jgi:crossover junction endodeoxyribonuclease RusA